MLTHKILRMAGIAEDRGELPAHPDSLSCVSSVARRDPTPPESGRPSSLSRVDATAKGKPTSPPAPLHRKEQLGHSQRSNLTSVVRVNYF